MKALVYDSYGDYTKLRVEEIAVPEPKDNEMLIRVHAASINHGDFEVLRGTMTRYMGYGLMKPKYRVLGIDVSGVVEAVGKDIKNFKVGDEVYGDLSKAHMGGFAEYTCVDENSVVIKPAKVSHIDAAASPTAYQTALQGIRNKGGIKAGETVAINGASGGVGNAALQLAVDFGADVTAVCSSRNTDRAKAYGAKTVIDYKKEDFTKGERKYDLIAGVNGYHSLKEYKNALKEDGRYVMIGGSGKQIFEGMLMAPFASIGTGKRLAGMGQTKVSPDDLTYIGKLIEEERIKPHIDKVFPLEEGKEAFKYFMEEHVAGKVVISCI